MKPEPGKTYCLTGPTGSLCIANGNSCPEKLERFRALLADQQTTGFYQTSDIHIHNGPKYVRIDIHYSGSGRTGAYMVEKATGFIYGIKAYGVVHRGHVYGTLDTIHLWDWSGYRAVKTMTSIPKLPRNCNAVEVRFADGTRSRVLSSDWDDVILPMIRNAPDQIKSVTALHVPYAAKRPLWEKAKVIR